MAEVDQSFVPPPEAPVFEPSEEDFADPLAYIAKIRPIAEKTGICKIRPPPDWQPPFAVDVENFRFTPRIQRLNELEAKTRIKLNFLDSIAKFWELQGCRLKIPNVCGKCLDLYNLSKIVQDEGGFEYVCRERRWSRVANRLHYPPGKGVGSQLLKHYERIIWPYDVFNSGVPLDQPVQPLPEGDAKDKDYVPHGIPSRQAIKPQSTGGYSRRVKRQAPEQEPLTVDISNNPELKKLQLFGPGPKFAGLGLVAQPGEKKDGLDGSWAKLERQTSTPEPDTKEAKPTKKPTKSSPRKAAQAQSQYQSPTLVQGQGLGQELAAGPSMQMRPRAGLGASYQIELYMCHTCGRGDAEDCLLLCDGCDDSFHTFCLIPPLPEVPKGDWRCPSCVAKGLRKPQDPFGFETARREYSLQTFGEKADQFKRDFFSMPVHMVPPETIEKEFWRLVQSIEDDVLVEYGADIHTLNQGSGFPTKKCKTVAPEDQEYVSSPWNLNNLPIQNESVLCHINADISGMKVPWIYVGMCFSSFCWHNEDHWSYSINYLHWGEPKTWYGVPGSSAEAFEQVMKNQAPELFDAQPDLLHQLVTIMNPTLLMEHGVPIVRTNQCAGEFVVTFPRAYHAGFNQGYNLAEAVNFCPSDWLPMGRQCIDHYRQLSRVCVFSHEELICKMATDPDSLDLNMAAAVYKEMLFMVDEEKSLRKLLLHKGVTEAEREAFELLPDDERQCESCKTTCFLSAITCPCTPNKVVCIRHQDKLCSCPQSKHCLRYRYTLDELPAMLHNLKTRAESFDNWAKKVKNALEAEGDSKLDMSQLKEMIDEADEKRFPDNDLLQQLINAVADAEKCASVAIQLVNKKHRTRSKCSPDSKLVTKLSYDELCAFMEQVQALPCEITETQLVQKLVDEVEKFRADAQDALCDAVPDSDKLRQLLEMGSTLDIELPEIPKLKLELHQARWLDDVRATLALATSVTLETLRKLIDSGVSLAPHQAIEKAMAELQELLTVSERWEEKAKICLAAKPRHAIATVEAIINEARNIPAHLPNTLALKEALHNAKEWSKQIEDIQSGEHYPYLDVLECMVIRGRTIPIRLEQLAQVESQVSAARAWRDRAGRTFLKKNTSYTLLEILSPRSDVGQYMSGKARRKKQKDMERIKEQEKEYATDVDINSSTTGTRDPANFMASYKNAEVEEFDAINTLRDKNRRKQQLEEDGLEQGKYCVCRKPVTGFMLQCELCKDWFHTTCVPLPKASKTKFASTAGGGTVSTTSGVQSIKDVKFLCPMCLRSRRPRLETILSLLVSLQKLPVRLPEGEALQRLTERAMNWTDRSKQALATDELADALTRLSSISQKMMEQAAKAKTDRIISAEIKKAKKRERREQAQALQGMMVPSMGSNVLEDTILHGIPPLPSQAVEIKMDDEEHVDVDMGVAITMETSSTDDMATDSAMVLSGGMDTGFASEHAYSAASKPASLQPSKKHPRKTPLVPRSMDPCSPTGLPTALGTNGSHSQPQMATLELSPYARAQLEDLMVEGDQLEVSLDETQHLWRILQACQPVQQERFLEHVLEMTPEGLEKLKVKSEIKEKKKMKLKRKREDLDTMAADVIKMEKKKKKKEKKEKEVSAVPTPPGTTPQKKPVDKVKKEGKENKDKQQKKKLKKKKAEKLLTPSGLAIKKENGITKEEGVVINVDGDDDEDDEMCSAKKCLRPLGDDINWVQCDSCEKWYHLLCIGMKKQPEEDEDFICRICTKKRAMKAGQYKSKHSTPGSSTSSTPVTTPSKQGGVKPSVLASHIAAQQQLATKGSATNQAVAKAQSSAKSSGRNSPSSGRNSPANMSVKSGSGRNSPALLSSAQKSSVTASFGRKSPVTLTTGGRSSPTTTSKTNISSVREALLATTTGRKSPLTFENKTQTTLPSTTVTPSPVVSSAVSVPDDVPQISQSVQQSVDSPQAVKESESLPLSQTSVEVNISTQSPAQEQNFVPTEASKPDISDSRSSDAAPATAASSDRYVDSASDTSVQIKPEASLHSNESQKDDVEMKDITVSSSGSSQMGNLVDDKKCETVSSTSSTKEISTEKADSPTPDQDTSSAQEKTEDGSQKTEQIISLQETDSDTPDVIKSEVEAEKALSSTESVDEVMETETSDKVSEGSPIIEAPLESEAQMEVEPVEDSSSVTDRESEQIPSDSVSPTHVATSDKPASDSSGPKDSQSNSDEFTNVDTDVTTTAVSAQSTSMPQDLTKEPENVEQQLEQCKPAEKAPEPALIEQPEPADSIQAEDIPESPVVPPLLQEENPLPQQTGDVEPMEVADTPAESESKEESVNDVEVPAAESL